MSAGTRRRLRILTWHVHGNYLWYLSHVPHDFVLPCDAARSPGYSGRAGTLPWPDNIIERPLEAIAHEPLDAILLQSSQHWPLEQHAWLSPAQRRLPVMALEHDPPLGHPTDTRHPVDDPNALLVHVTPYNALMWDPGRTPTAIVEHGVAPLRPSRWHGEVPGGVVVVNHLAQRGRRLGADLVECLRPTVPLRVIGMDAERWGGVELPNDRVCAEVVRHRFFFHPARYTSLGLAVIEAMMCGCPIVGLPTTELAAVVRDGHDGLLRSTPDALRDAMQALIDDPALARRIGEAGRRTALERFHIERFVADWCALLQRFVG